MSDTENEKLQTKITRLRKALQFYADPQLYRGRVVNDGGGYYDMVGFDILSDEGKRAKRTLAVTQK